MTLDGRFVKARFGSGFTFTLKNDGLTLPPDDYIIMIDPVWDNEELDDVYKDIIVSIYSIESTDLIPLQHDRGMTVLTRALKDAAINQSTEQKHYLYDKTDYKECVRV